jgi:hypothetical protein
VHLRQGPRELGVGQAAEQAGLHAMVTGMVQQVAQGLQQQDLEQSIGQQALAAAHTLRLGKQQRERVLDVWQGGHRQGHQGRQGLHQRVLGAAVKVQRGADEVAAVHRRVVEVMCQRLRVEQQRGLADDEAARRTAAGGVGHAHLAAPQHVQKGPPRLRREVRDPAQRPGMEEVGAHPEALQQGREPVNGVGRADGGAHGRTAMLGGRNASNDTD